MTKKILEWVKVIVLSLLVAFIINNFVVLNASIPTGSMQPTINIGDRLFANRLSYLLGEPDRGDIVVFESNKDDKMLVKRVIGLPGDTIEIHDQIVFINGLELDDYTEILVNGNFGPYVVPEEHYFFLGDNRNGSHDSRHWVDPYIHIDAIQGKAMFRYFPKIKLF